MKILVLVLAPLGDTLFTTPSLKALRKGYPGAEIEVMVYESSKDIIAGNNNIDELIIITGKAHLFTKIVELRVQEYDLVIGLSHTGSYLCSLINSRKKAGLKADELDWIYDYNLSDNRDIHAVDYCLEVVKAAGAQPDRNPRLELPVSEKDYLTVEQLLYNYGVQMHLPLLAVHPGGKFFSLKRWPVEKFRQLIKRIDQELETQVVLIGSRNERHLADKIVDNSHNYLRQPLIFSGELNIKETAALLDISDLFIGNDSAPQHIAAAMGTRVISLFGPTNPENFYPYGTDYKIISAGLECSPCFSWLGDLKQYLPDYLPEWAGKCKGSCMKLIKVNQVIEGIKVLMSEYRQGVLV